ncbi:MAG: single-stranded-DNA-specific exonuclease RecJ [Rhodobacteraceae bacterium]|nr:single-stranded-DNA-specific exonuclease RecJ [Paracoccaceae bacterium]
MTAFLGVERSLTGRRWIGPDAKQARLTQALHQREGLLPAVAQVLARRGVLPEDAGRFLAPTLRDLLPDPRRLRGMEAAGARLLQALSRRERVAIFADYDVDGGASAALLLDWLRQQGHDATLYIPDRIDEGYGPNAPAMAKLAQGHDLIICVDCGTQSHAPIAAAKGADVMVLDHHLAGATLPDCLAVVNPNRQDEDGRLGHLCAAGVVFLLLVEANRQARAAGCTGPDLRAMLDLVALATVADVAPMVGVNRAFVRQGLSVMARRVRPGLVALTDAAGLDQRANSSHLGFVLGPRVNAGGRIGKADMGARLLSSTSRAEAEPLAALLETYNTDRREIEDQVRNAALAQIGTRATDGALVWAADQGWHPGVVGIVASRLAEMTHRPAIVIGFEGDAGKGSGRSIPGVDLGAAVQRLVAEGLLARGGGHRMAAGLSLTRAQLAPAMARLEELLARQGAAADRGAADLRLDGALMPGGVTPGLIEELEAAGPFGAAAPAPRFAVPDVTIGHARRVGDAHLKLRLNADGGQALDVICFRAFETALGQALAETNGRPVHLAGRVEINVWRGRRSAQLRLDDAAWAG